jgi:hypothetical protein
MAPALPGPSEPEHVDLPASYTPSKFHMSLGEQVGGGFLGFIGGGVAGGVIAAFSMFADGGMSEGSDTFALAAFGLGVIGGPIAGVFIDRSLQHSRFDKAELQRQDEQVGKPVDRFAQEFIASYDHSADGKIQLTNDTGLPDRDERLTFETRDYTTSSFHFDPNDHDVLGGNPFGDSTTQHGTEQRAVSAVKLWQAADADGDKVVTRAELDALAAPFDANHDGFLNAGERKAITAQHPLLEGSWSVSQPAS